MNALLLIAAALTMTRPAPQAPPQDALTICATKALRGDFGKLKPWQERWYRNALDHGAARHRVWETQYGPWDRHPFKGDDYHLAANELPMGTVVWIYPPGQLRKVMTTGAHRNDRIARGKKFKDGTSCGYEFWADVWTRTKHEMGLDTCGADLWVINDGGER
jgi:hypothetical protein